jgi:heme/copper-type cytochrome/quinol oxidase subunit 3
MVETLYLESAHRTHPQGPPPIIPPPPDGPDRGGPHDDGGEERRRFPLKNEHLLMMIVLGTETIFFASLFVACLILRQGAPVWPPSTWSHLPTKWVFLATLFLFMSAVTMWKAQRARRQWELTQSAQLLFSTTFLGMTFLVCQGVEWMQLNQLGLTPAVGLYGSIFYMLIGCHALHVSVGVIWLVVVTWRAYQRDTDMMRSIGLSLCSLYWYYLVALWPILYAILYISWS